MGGGIGEGAPPTTGDKPSGTRIKSSSICSLNKENTYKILMHWYHTPDVLHAIYHSVPDRCWRCTAHRGTLFHIFWGMPANNIILEVGKLFSVLHNGYGATT